MLTPRWPPSAIEQGDGRLRKVQKRDHAEALTEYIFGQIAAGQTDEEKLAHVYLSPV